MDPFPDHCCEHLGKEYSSKSARKDSLPIPMLFEYERSGRVQCPVWQVAHQESVRQHPPVCHLSQLATWSSCFNQSLGWAPLNRLIHPPQVGIPADLPYCQVLFQISVEQIWKSSLVHPILTLQPLQVNRVKRCHCLRVSRGPADTSLVDCPHAEGVGASFK